MTTEQKYVHACKICDALRKQLEKENSALMDILKGKVTKEAERKAFLLGVESGIQRNESSNSKIESLQVPT
mgnify:CR=1 FL=1